MTDQLANIKARFYNGKRTVEAYRVFQDSASEDIDWLIAEVERLRSSEPNNQDFLSHTISQLTQQSSTSEQKPDPMTDDEIAAAEKTKNPHWYMPRLISEIKRLRESATKLIADGEVDWCCADDCLDIYPVAACEGCDHKMCALHLKFDDNGVHLCPGCYDSLERG